MVYDEHFARYPYLKKELHAMLTGLVISGLLAPLVIYGCGLSLYNMFIYHETRDFLVLLYLVSFVVLLYLSLVIAGGFLVSAVSSAEIFYHMKIISGERDRLTNLGP